ncbi:MAG TPA: hypothetical protein VNE39_22040 [Planctomycetota bacterium]|nr:hypothetical protein [Planctomycetota bacterium]
MGVLRKHLAWVIVGVVLLAEVAALFFVTGKKSEAEAARESLEKLREQRDRLKREVFDIEKRIEIHQERKALGRRELGDCALFLWHQGQAIEGLFEAKELGAYEVYPWQPPRSFDVFKVEYQGVYNREVEKLEPLMQKVGADAAMLGFADPAGLAQANVLIGDVYAMQKEFWIKKELVRILAEADAQLLAITLGAGAAAPARRHLPAGKAVVAPGKLAEGIPIQLTFACDYMLLNDLLGALLRSRLCLRIESVNSVARAKLGEAQPAAKAKAGVVAPEESPAAAVGQLERREYVAVDLRGEISNLAVEVQEVLFPRPAFGDKAKAAEFVELQLRRAEARLKRVEVPDAAKRPEESVPWIARELDQVQKAASGAAGKALPPVADELFERREYVFGDMRAAREWLARRYDFEQAKLEAHVDLWQRARAAVQSGRADDRNKVGVFVTDEGVVVAFRPANHFDPNEWYEVEFDPGVRVKLGLVVYSPQESREGVKRAPKGTGR